MATIAAFLSPSIKSYMIKSPEQNNFFLLVFERLEKEPCSKTSEKDGEYKREQFPGPNYQKLSKADKTPIILFVFFFPTRYKKEQSSKRLSQLKLTRRQKSTRILLSSMHRKITKRMFLRSRNVCKTQKSSFSWFMREGARTTFEKFSSLGKLCTDNAKVVGSNPFQSLKFFQVIFTSRTSAMAVFASAIICT